uniref:Uncharacterized protein n=1 Tax=Salix viminalis TaxID=40686 RepID=A0A6N2MQK8_SALVM
MNGVVQVRGQKFKRCDDEIGGWLREICGIILFELFARLGGAHPERRRSAWGDLCGTPHSPHRRALAPLLGFSSLAHDREQTSNQTRTPPPPKQGPILSGAVFPLRFQKT